MHPFVWVLVGTGWLLALAAWMLARRQSRRLAELTKMYWEVKYECGELKARLRALAPDATDASPSASPARPPQGFVALSDVKRKP
jgi:hypothetical protein